MITEGNIKLMAEKLIADKVRAIAANLGAEISDDDQTNLETQLRNSGATNFYLGCLVIGVYTPLSYVCKKSQRWEFSLWFKDRSPDRSSSIKDYLSREEQKTFKREISVSDNKNAEAIAAEVKRRLIGQSGVETAINKRVISIAEDERREQSFKADVERLKNEIGGVDTGWRDKSIHVGELGLLIRLYDGSWKVENPPYLSTNQVIAINKILCEAKNI